MAWLPVVDPGCPVACEGHVADSPLGDRLAKGCISYWILIVLFCSFCFFGLVGFEYLMYSYNWPLSLFPQPKS